MSAPKEGGWRDATPPRAEHSLAKIATALESIAVSLERLAPPPEPGPHQHPEGAATYGAATPPPDDVLAVIDRDGDTWARHEGGAAWVCSGGARGRWRDFAPLYGPFVPADTPTP